MSTMKVSHVSSDSDSEDAGPSFHFEDDANAKTLDSRRRVGLFDRMFDYIMPRTIGERLRLHSGRERKNPFTKKIIHSTILILLVTSLAIMTWLAVVLTVANRLSSRLELLTTNNGIQQILQTYHAPTSTSAASPLWLPEFSNGILPVQCHSHNDYWHRIPLYEGLAAGCVSTEADIWIGKSEAKDGELDLFVGHSSKSLSSTRTLKSLYLDPIYDILTHQNINETDVSGVFSMSPNTSLVLLLDFKTSDNDTWNEVTSQLSALRSQGWLTHWTPQAGVVSRPVTVVATGDAPFASIIANTTYRDIFYDAPLTSLSKTDNPYNNNNSYYASSSLPAAVGRVWLGKFSGEQRAKIGEQAASSKDLGLRSRYWDTPAWPVGWRNRIWEQLVELEVIGGREGEAGGVLNVDDVKAGTRWDWNLCVVGGVNVCLS